MRLFRIPPEQEEENKKRNWVMDADVVVETHLNSLCHNGDWCADDHNL